MGSTCPRGKEHPHWFEWAEWRIFWHRNVFDSYMKSWQYFHTQDIVGVYIFWLSKMLLRFARNLQKNVILISGTDHPSIHIAARHAAGFNRCHEIKSPVWKSPREEFHDEMSLPAAILLSNDICRGANMLLPLHNSLHWDMSRVTISIHDDVSEGGDFIAWHWL